MNKDDDILIRSNHRLAEAMERMAAEDEAYRHRARAPVAAPLNPAAEIELRHRIFSDPNSPWTRAAEAKRKALELDS